MTYQNSLLSLYPPPPVKALNKGPDVDFTSQFEEELPATAPVFEGHLYLRTDKKQWQWRLFRFDGTSFTCLSTRKVKLPPNTHVDAPPDDQPFRPSLPSSFQATSLTSPLLATPKTKSRQQSTTSATTPLAKYYQLPKWTVDIANISAVSVLKPNNSSTHKRKLAVVTSSSSQKQARCFCVRTFDGNCYIMKAHKQKDLERWLFVLTKMWKFAQTMKLQLLSQQPQNEQIIRQQQHQQQQQHSRQQQQQPFHGNIQPHHHPLLLQSPYHSSFVTTSSTSRLQPQSQDSIPLSRMYQRPRHMSLEKGNIAEHSLPIVKSQTTPTPFMQHATRKPLSIYEQQYHHPMLSVEKSECIDAWRQSLCELMSVDPQLQVSTPPPIESIPDDDQISVISDMTSISHRKPALRRRVSIASSTSKRSSRSIKMKPRDSSAPQKLKKKRSNDVKNWIEPRKPDPFAAHGLVSSLTPPTPAGAMSTSHPIGYFQDGKPTATTLSLEGDEGDKVSRDPIALIQEQAPVTMDRHAKYHGSTRAKQIHITDPNHHDAVSSSDNFNAPAKPFLSSSSSLMAKPPLLQPTVNLTKSQDEEEISLADLQRSLKRASLHHQATVSSSSLVSTERLRYDQHHQHPMAYQPFATVTAPAIPPYYMNNTPSMASSPSIHISKDVYRHQTRKKSTDHQREQRRNSWVSSCDQQKVLQHRRSIPLDALQW